MPFRFMGLTYQCTEHDLECLLRALVRCEDTLAGTNDQIKGEIVITGNPKEVKKR